MPPRLEAIDGTLAALRGVALDRLGPDGAAGFEAAMAEALANIVLHACAGGPPHAVRIAVGPEAGGLRVEIADRGRPGPADLYDAAPALDAIDPLRTDGRGRAIVRHFAAAVDYRPGPDANRLTLTFAGPPGGNEGT